MGFENNGLQLLETWYDKLSGINWSSRFGTPNGLVITKRVPCVVAIYDGAHVDGFGLFLRMAC